MFLHTDAHDLLKTCWCSGFKSFFQLGFLCFKDVSLKIFSQFVDDTAEKTLVRVQRQSSISVFLSYIDYLVFSN